VNFNACIVDLDQDEAGTIDELDNEFDHRCENLHPAFHVNYSRITGRNWPVLPYFAITQWYIA
jgi:hypothetical protein